MSGNPVQSVQAELLTVGAMMMAPHVLEHALAELQADDFSRPNLRVMFEAMGEMRSAGEPVDEFTLRQWMKHRKTTPQDVARTFDQIGEADPLVAMHKSYVREVKDHALLRGLAATGHGFVQAAHEADPALARASRDEHPVRAAITAATAQLIELRERVEGRTFARKADLGALIDEWGARYVLEQGDPDASLAIPFPEHLPQLNAWSMGQRPGRLIVSSGGTGHGKSWFGLDCTETMMLHGERVAYFSLELPGDEILERLIGMGGVSYAAIQQRTADWDSMHDRINELSASKHLLTVLDGTTTLERIEAEVVAARVAGKPYRYVVIDTTNQVELPGRVSDETGEIAKMYRRLKNLAIDHRLTVHAQAQLNREWNKNRDPSEPPRISDLKGGSSIEQNADLVLFVHRIPGAQADTLSDAAVLVVAKGRNIRRRGRIGVGFDPTGLRFREPVRAVRSVS